MTMARVCGFVLCFFLGFLALTILYLIWTKQIDLKYLLSEPNGDASMSRFQLLIFTFVVAFGLFEVIENNMSIPDIPTGVLTLLGISASTYAVSKGISYSAPEVMMNTPKSDGSAPAVPPAAPPPAGGHAGGI